MNAVLAERTEWLNNRRAGIGGSDVAPLLGLSKWKTPLDVYLDKRGESAQEQADSEPMFWGRALEPVIRQTYADRTGRTVSVQTEILQHQTHAFMLANVDGLTDDRRVFEAKTARTGEGWGEPGTDEVPDAYALQVQHYLAVTGFQIADVAVLIGGSDFRLYHIEADAGLQGDLIEAEAEFWQRILDGNPPEPVTFSEVQQRFGRSDAAGLVEADVTTAQVWSSYHVLRKQIDALQDRADDLKAKLVNTLADGGDTLAYQGKTLATWKLAKAPERFDAVGFKKAHPEIAAAFTVAGTPSRRLLIKE